MHLSKKIAWRLLSLGGLGLVACASGTPANGTAQTPANNANAASGTAATRALPLTAQGETDAPIPIASTDPTWGDRNAPVTIVEFSDLESAPCARGQQTLAALEKEYGPASLRVVWKNFPLPFHKQAKAAATAAQGVFAMKGPTAFFTFIDKALAGQKDLESGALLTWANEVGVPSADFSKGLGGQEWAAKVEADLALANKMGVDAAPAFFVNGVLLPGAVPESDFKSLIDHELERAKSMTASGMQPERVYIERSRDNFKLPAAPAPDKHEPEEEADSKTVYRVPVGNSPMRGPANALVTIVEFSDFQCPYCAGVEPTLKALKAKYGDAIRVVWKHHPLSFHEHAEPAAELAEEARAEKGSDGFWAAHDALFEHQHDLSRDALLGIAKTLGLNETAAKTAIDSHKYREVIDGDEDQGSDFGADGTPHFFINGRRLAGAQPIEGFSSLIDAEVAHAKAVLAGAQPTPALYDSLVKDGVVPNVMEIPVSPKAPAKGDVNAPVTISVFADFQCPFCGRAEVPLREVEHLYGKQVRFVWHNYPLPMHEHARLAAEAGLEAYAQKGSAGFWKMHDTLFSHQEEAGGLDRSALDGYARSMGLDLKRWATALDQHTHQGEVDADMKVAETAGVEATPTIVINGHVLMGAQPLPRFRRVIDRALSEASKKKPSGKP